MHRYPFNESFIDTRAQVISRPSKREKTRLVLRYDLYNTHTTSMTTTTEKSPLLTCF